MSAARYAPVLLKFSSPPLLMKRFPLQHTNRCFTSSPPPSLSMDLLKIELGLSDAEAQNMISGPPQLGSLKCETQQDQ